MPLTNNRLQEIENYLTEIDNLDTLPDEKELSILIQSVKEGDITATEKLTSAYRNIAIKIAQQECYKTDLPVSELVDKGIAGFVKGIRQSGENTEKIFDHAAWWIRQSMFA